jgi:hypothetical protein
MSDPINDPKLAKAELQAAKARANAMRPWFKKKRFIVPIALVVLIGLSQAMNGGDGSSTSSTDTSSTTEAETSTDTDTSGETSNESAGDSRPGIGEAAVDGKFSFTVTGLECGIQSVGSDSFGEEAQGQFCKVSLTIENIGDEPQTMFADSQKLFDSEGREFSADTSAMIYLDEGGDTWFSEINPGNSLDGVLLFDVPADATLDYIKLYDSLFSSGIEVSLK